MFTNVYSYNTLLFVNMNVLRLETIVLILMLHYYWPSVGARLVTVAGVCRRCLSLSSVVVCNTPLRPAGGYTHRPGDDLILPPV